ncbi:MAG: hypothetical protein ABWX68_12785 [Arthrobacter sp.]|uniref:hypothetical protein n=1 Tax=Arthrobacter sp. TaxID=1667 RepID=UPI0034761B00
MIRMLLQAAINLVTAAAGLLLAGAMTDGVALQTSRFVTAVIVFVVAQVILGPFVFNMARQYASSILGGVGLVWTLLAISIATLVPDRLAVTGLAAWILTPLLAWRVTALGDVDPRIPRARTVVGRAHREEEHLPGRGLTPVAGGRRVLGSVRLFARWAGHLAEPRGYPWQPASRAATP